MRRCTFTFCLSVSFLAILSYPFAPVAHPKGKEPRGIRKTGTNDVYKPFLINNVFNYYANNGDGSYNPFSSDNEGLNFPKDGYRTTTFEDGILWGGYHRGRTIPCAGGSLYRHALQAGRIVTAGNAAVRPVADDPSHPRYRVYRVRPHVNPGTPFDAAMESRLAEEEAAFIGRFESVTARSIYNQYIADWNEWPASDGAPYYDVDGDGMYNPLVDVPGVPGADQTLWYVANDLDSMRVLNLSGSPPIGLEMQRTIWGYKRSGGFENTIFAGTKLINRSGARVDSMYIAQFADIDIGSGGDDYAGCDTVRDLSYEYNGYDADVEYGNSVPAVGFALLQGPIVPGASGDTAWFGMRGRPGFRNLRPSSATIFTSGYPQYADPVQGPGGDIMLFRLFEGLTRDGAAFVDPASGKPVRFVFPGDPVTGTGWIENTTFLRPGDRRILFSTGPFSMAAGDTQEVVVAHLVAQGPDRLSSITLLKRSLDSVRSGFRRLPSFPSPDFHVGVGYPASSQASVTVSADARGSRAKAVAVSLKRSDGSQVAQLQLTDDGAHGDGGAGDGVFGGTLIIAREQSPVSMSASVLGDGNATFNWEEVAGPLTTAGPLVIGEPRIFADGINSDGKANPGEGIRYGISLRNGGAFGLVNLMTIAGSDTHRVALLPPGGIDSMVYNPSDPNSFFPIWVPTDPHLAEYDIPLKITDDRGNTWGGTSTFHVSPLPFEPRNGSMTRISGKASGDFGVLIVDPSQFRRDRYRVLGVDSIDAQGHHGITVLDSTDGRILLHNHPLPDSWSFNVPLTDGFKILQGDTRDHSGTMLNWSVPAGTRFWSAVMLSDSLGLEGFFGLIGNAFDHWPSGGVGYDRQHSVVLSFAKADSSGNFVNPADTTVSFAYRYLANATLPPAHPEFARFITNPSSGYAYQDYKRSVPFAAYDTESVPPHRLMVGFLENNVPAGMVDGKYWPPTAGFGLDNAAASGPREWFFIFDMAYDQTPSPVLQIDVLNTHVPLMWVGYPSRRALASFADGGQFVILTGHAPGGSDVWSFGLSHDDFLPASYTLLQNYPNPFNPETTIRYTLSNPSRVTLRIYNVLGQLVRTLVDESQYGGEFNVAWDGKSDGGVIVATGVYIYRLEASGLNDSRQSVSAVKKMLLLR